MRRSSKSSEEVVCRCNVDVSLAAGSHNVNVFKVHGTVRVIDQVAEIKSITTLTNLTAMYADLYDGTNTVLLTDNSPGASLSGVAVGSVFTRDQDSSNAYTVSDASQCRMSETTSDRQIGLPFTVTQKNGADTYIRLNLTTTDDPVVFSLSLKFKWEPVDGGWLEMVA